MEIPGVMYIPLLRDNPALVVVAMSVVSCICNEFLAWLFVYRRDRYKHLKAQLLSGEKKLEVIRATPSTDKGDGNTKAKKRKEKLIEDQMKAHLQEVNNLKFMNMFLTGVLMFGFYQLLTQTYKGIPVAQLPFEPIPLIRMLSHRGLPESSPPRLVSVTFFYLLCQAAMRTLVGKVFNHGLRASLTNIPTSATAMGMMQDNKTS